MKRNIPKSQRQISKNLIRGVNSRVSPSTISPTVNVGGKSYVLNINNEFFKNINLFNYYLNIVNSDEIQIGIFYPDSDKVMIPDSLYRIEYVGGTFITSGSIPSSGSALIEIPVIPCEPVIYEIKNIANNILRSGSEASGGNIEEIINNSIITLKDTANNTLFTSSFFAEENGEIIAPSGSYINTDNSVSGSIRSGEINHIIADIDVEVNTVKAGEVVALKKVNINLEDSDGNPVVPDSIDVVGNNVTAVVPSSPQFDPEAFVIQVDTGILGQTNENQFLIQVAGTIFGNNYDVKTSDGQTFTGQTGNLTITFPSKGQYLIEIKGTIAISYFITLDRNKLLKVLNWGLTSIGLNRAFEGCSNLQIEALDAPNLQAGFTQRIFNGRITINDSIGSWDISPLTSILAAFQNNSVFNSNINNWDVSGMTSLSTINNELFIGCSSFNQPLDLWDVSANTSFYSMFSGCRRFNQDLSTWNVSSGTSFYSMFSGCSVFNQDISNWNMSNAKEVNSMFQQASAFNQDLSTWDVSNITNFTLMFYLATSFNQNLGAWQLRLAGTSLSNIFRNSGMSTANYTDTIVGWANYVFNNSGTPSGVNMINQAGMTFDTSRSGGTNFADAGAARTYLTTTAGWTITNDTII